jgi:histone-lysine N-methyltransferase SETMAR
MIITFFNIKGIVHIEFFPTGQSVNSGFYCDVLWQLRENAPRRHPELRQEQTQLLHHDNTLFLLFHLHPAMSGETPMAVILHPPYSPDLAPCDLFLFPTMKFKLKGRQFNTIEEIQAES